MKKILVLISFLVISQAQSIETKIIHFIQNEIITNIDIKNEFKYLIALNNSLKELDKERILIISNDSIIREKIKKIEIEKNFKKIQINEDYLNLLLKNIYESLGLKSVNEFEIYLKDYNLTLSNIEEKMTIDALWNELIIKKYSAKITLNEDKIKEEILKNSKTQSKEFQLSEIIFEISNKEEIKKKYNGIVKSINEIGFENSASVYSISDSAKIGGNIGWINENSLNNKIKKNIDGLKIGEISEPIILPSGILILKLVNIKKIENMIDVNKKFDEAVNYERNRQLNQYSKIYYNKVKKNLDFNE